MADFSQLDNKVSLQDIDVESYKTQVSDVTSGEVARSEVGEEEGSIRIMGNDQHTITFKIDNSATAFNLSADTRTFADWGSFGGAPSNVSSPVVFVVCES